MIGTLWASQVVEIPDSAMRVNASRGASATAGFILTVSNAEEGRVARTTRHRLRPPDDSAGCRSRTQPSRRTVNVWVLVRVIYHMEAPELNRFAALQIQ